MSPSKGPCSKRVNLFPDKSLSKKKYETSVVERLDKDARHRTHSNSVVSLELVRFLLTIIESDRCLRTYKVSSEARFLKILGGTCLSLFELRSLLNKTGKSKTKHVERQLKPDFLIRSASFLLVHNSSSNAILQLPGITFFQVYAHNNVLNNSCPFLTILS